MAGILGRQMQPVPPGQPHNPGSQGGQTNMNVSDMVDSDGQITNMRGWEAAQVGDPSRWEVTQDQTVQGQLHGIMSKGSQLQELAKQQALEQMNDRGLTSSSHAINAAQRAVIESALPIAQADAATHGKAAMYNSDYKNKFMLQNADWRNQAAQYGAEASNIAARSNSTMRNQRKINTENNETQRWVTQKQVDVQHADIGMRRELGHRELDVRHDLGNKEINLKGQLGNRELDIKDKLGTRELDIRNNLGFAEIGLKKELGWGNINATLSMNQMDNNTKLMAAEIDGEYRNLIQTNANAGAAYNQMIATMADIDKSNLSVDAKRNAQRRLQMQVYDQMRVLGAVGGVPNLEQWFNTNWYSQ